MATRRRPLRELSAKGLPNDANRTKIHRRSESEKGPSPKAAMGGDIRHRGCDGMPSRGDGVMRTEVTVQKHFSRILPSSSP